MLTVSIQNYRHKLFYVFSKQTCSFVILYQATVLCYYVTYLWHAEQWQLLTGCPVSSSA